MAYILFAKPNNPRDVQGAKGEIPVASGTLKAMREKKLWWERQDETCRIVNTTTNQEVE
jgi:hypothetical protein